MTLERELRWLDAQVSLEAKRLPKAGATDGLGNETIRSLLELLGDPHLDAPVIRVTGKDVPMPYAANLEKLALPTVEDVIQAAKAALYI